MSANDHQRSHNTSMDVEPARLSMKASSAWNVNSMSDFEAEREVLGELLERLDVDVPSVEIERRYHRSTAPRP